MKTRVLATGLLVGWAALVGSGCTWVRVSPEAEGVRLVSPERASSCERIGSAHSRTSTAVGPFARAPKKIREEQASLARNEAARMGGNAISPEGPAEDGEQAFGVYRCTEGS